MTCIHDNTSAPIRPATAPTCHDDSATDRQRRYLAALGVPVPEGLTKGQARELITQAKREGRAVVNHDAWGDDPPSPNMVATLASYGLAAPTTQREASRLLTTCQVEGRSRTRCRRGMHPRDEAHGRHLENGTWRCTACRPERQAGSPGSRPQSGLGARSAATELVLSLVTKQPFQHGIGELARALGRSHESVSRAIRRLEAEGVVVIRKERGFYGRKLVGAVS